ncbi:sodium-dependent transporter [Larsenimonas suaedae]|uniref:Transporter n=1 Tax=Larsenimonas suaedae TaxID=1851019 RepID=A0ABU1GRT7_9GAMM|nr:sodium-dependent transporter [Larsenimonas suaedae]MCM2972468.1 sodium-dependent transporter [Larsenimonas suaedae]MDR5894736.1 sodium-dependent transporter [Larsenimonas suaedae]
MSQSEAGRATREPPIWKGRITFVMAAAGSAVGLGNIWKFPYIVGENGGGAFVLVYLACILLFGVPLLMAEIGLGRATRANAFSAFKQLSARSKASSQWKWVGGLGIVTSYLILSFYIVVAGWCLYYFVVTVSGDFTQSGQTLTQADTGARFDGVLASPVLLIVASTTFLLTVFLIVASGIKNGIEKSVNWMMPSLMVMLVLLAIYSAQNGMFMKAFDFLFSPDFSKLTLESVLIAVGHSFFTLSLASGSMVTYGAYMNDSASIGKTALAVAGIDTMVALTAGLAIFPLIFAHGLEPTSGPGLMFISLPLIFEQMPFGQIFGAAFFFLMFIAALTSGVSLMEPTVAWLEQQFSMKRLSAAFLTTVSLCAMSLLSAFSFNIWDAKWLFGMSFFDGLDFLTANVFMTIVALATALFCGYCLKPEQLQQMFGHQSRIIPVFTFSMRFVAPAFVGLMVYAAF